MGNLTWTAIQVNNVLGEESKVKVIPHRRPGIPLQQATEWSHNTQQNLKTDHYVIITSTKVIPNSKRFSVCHYTVGVKFNFLKFWSSLFGINVCQTIKRRVYLYHPLKVATNIRFENISLGNWLAVCTKTPSNPFTKRIFA